MTLPSELLFAIAASGGGKVALIVGAGCSVEAPTSIPVAATCSARVHDRLINDGVLSPGDCSNSDDLSAVADAVFEKTGSQRELVMRLLDEFPLKLPAPNEGYSIAAALLAEGAVTSLITLNYDLAISVAVSALGAGTSIGVVESPEELGRERATNVYYLHRSANEVDPNKWVLRTPVLEAEWRNHWEEIIATKVLATSVVVFAGLGSPIAVLLTSIDKLRSAMPASSQIYQVDPRNKEESPFFAQLQPTAYIQQPWGEFMRALSARLTVAHRARLQIAIDAKRKEDALTEEEYGSVLANLDSLGLLRAGQLRSRWFLDERPYTTMTAVTERLMADIVLGVAMMERVSGAIATLLDDGVIEFRRDGRPAVAVLVASGQGHRGRVAVEARVAERLRVYRAAGSPSAVVAFGTTDWTEPVAPQDILLGNVEDDDILRQSAVQILHIGALRAAPARVAEVVPQ